MKIKLSYAKEWLALNWVGVAAIALAVSVGVAIAVVGVHYFPATR
jgi:hypothetical protein